MCSLIADFLFDFGTKRISFTRTQPNRILFQSYELPCSITYGSRS